MLLWTPVVNAEHEGPYIIGQQKHLTDDVYFACFDEEAASSVLNTLKRFGLNAMRSVFEESGCQTVNGVITIVRQLGEDVVVTIDDELVPFRFVHGRYADPGATRFEVYVQKNVYILTWGENTKVLPAP